MVLQEQATQTEQTPSQDRKYLGLIVKYVLKFLSSLILPLMLGIFTVVVTFQQQKVARQQRLEDKNESRLQREQDWNISQTAIAAQSNAIADRYRDEVLVAYVKEIGDLLEKKNGSLTSDPLTATLARVKTLNTLRQLDGPRQSHVLRFLYEAKQLSNTDGLVALDVSTAELTNIDFHKLAPVVQIEKISLAGVFLKNCTLSRILLYDVDFSFTFLYNVNFSSAELSNVNFLSVYFKDVDFSFAYLSNVSISSAKLENVNFSSAELNNVNFSSTILKKVAFSSAKFDVFIGRSSFHRAKMAGTVFEGCACENLDFSGADLRYSSFHRAELNKANFSFANLREADLTNTTITDDQLQSTLSIRNAKLPNGTLGRGRNWIQNGDPNCNASLVDHWHVQNGSIIVVSSKENRSKCHFSLQSPTTKAMMSQRIDLRHIWDSSFWRYEFVELQADMSSGVSIELISKGSDGTILDTKIANSTNTKIATHIIFDVQELEIVVKFNAHNNKNDNENIWCDNIELFIEFFPP